MAKVKAGLPLITNLGSHSIYQRKDLDALIVRAKGGPTKETINSSPKLVNLKKVNSEFSGAGKSSGKIQRAMYAVTHLADSILSGRLTAVATIIQKRDTEHPRGKRSILFSKYPHILDGFSINAVTPLETYLKTPFTYTISRNDLSAVVNIPELIPKINFKIPAGYTFYRIIAVLGIVPDLLLGATEYEPANPDIIYAPRQDETDWLPVKSSNTGSTLQIQLPPNNNFDASCSLILSVGIEFGKYLTDNIVKPGKDVGSARILAQV